jgi:peroxiredoxin
MKLKACAVFALIIVVSLILSLSCTPSCPEIGSKAPDFTLATTKGESISLAGLTGSKVMVNLWSCRCGPCVSEMPHIQAIYEKWSDKGVKVLAVNVGDNAKTAQEFASENGFTFPILIDSKMQLFKLYCLQQVIPITLFIDAEGNLQAKKLGAFSSEAEIENYLNSLQ